MTDTLRALIEAGQKIDYVLAIGPIPMMGAVAETTRPHGIRTIVSLNSIMVDGTGMCGGCRVSVGGKSLFACVDGPEFDAHQVDFKNLASRNAMYREAEARALSEFLANPERDLSLVHECRLLAPVEAPGLALVEEPGLAPVEGPGLAPAPEPGAAHPRGRA